ncbi:hypothetical protein KIPB_013561, partial [Kipferlia bialata]
WFIVGWLFPYYFYWCIVPIVPIFYLVTAGTLQITVKHIKRAHGIPIRVGRSGMVVMGNNGYAAGYQAAQPVYAPQPTGPQYQGQQTAMPNPQYQAQAQPQPQYQAQPAAAPQPQYAPTLSLSLSLSSCGC